MKVNNFTNEMGDVVQGPSGLTSYTTAVAVNTVMVGGLPFSGTPTTGQVVYYDGAQWTPATLIRSGTHAARPAAATTNTGWVYVETDTLWTYLSTGAAWTLITPFATSALGGKETVSTVAASGASQTLNLANGNLFDVTLTANCTLTFSGATSGVLCGFMLWARQDGTGSRFVTWPGSVTWSGGTAPVLSTTAAALDEFVFETVDGGGTWLGHAIGGGGTVTTGSTAGAHVHVHNVTFSGDGATVAFEIPAAPVDAYSVAAYVNGARVDMTLSNAMLTTMTFGTAPGTGTDNIRVDIEAVLV